MQDMLFKALGYGSEVLIVITGIFSAYWILRKNKEYLANKLISGAFFLIGLYGLAFLIYDLIASVPVIQISYRLGLAFLITGVLMLFFGVKILAHSQFWVKKSKLVPIGVLFTIGYIIWISFSDFIQVVALQPVVNTRINLTQLAVLILAVYLMMGNALNDIIRYGLKRVQGDVYKRMLVFTIGYSLTLLSAVISTISQIISGVDVYFDIAYFVVLSISLMIMTAGLVGKGGVEREKAE